MKHETDLVGVRRTATRAVGGELRLMQLNQVFGLAACAIQALVDPLGRADIEAGDDEADVEAELRRLNTGDGAPFAIPGLCLVARLRIAAQNGKFSMARRVRMLSATRRLSWREAWCRTDRRGSRCRCSRTTSSPRPSICPSPRNVIRVLCHRVRIRRIRRRRWARTSMPPGVLPGRRMTATGVLGPCRRRGSAESSVRHNER